MKHGVKSSAQPFCLLFLFSLIFIRSLVSLSEDGHSKGTDQQEYSDESKRCGPRSNRSPHWLHGVIEKAAHWLAFSLSGYFKASHQPIGSIYTLGTTSAESKGLTDKNGEIIKEWEQEKYVFSPFCLLQHPYLKTKWTIYVIYSKDSYYP